MRQTRQIGLFFFICTFLSGSLLLRTGSYSYAKDIIVNEGELLELNCTGRIGSSFTFFPHNLSDIFTSNVNIKTFRDDNGKYVQTLSRLSAITGDTGSYHCKNDTNSYIETYVYVKSDVQLLVPYTKSYIIYNDFDYKNIIPCRPTSPNYNVTISTVDNSTNNRIQSSFNPKNGFMIFNPIAIDSNQYKCSATREDGFTQTIDFYVNVTYPDSIRSFRMSSVIPRYVVEGESVNINCTVRCLNNKQIRLQWYGPPNKTLIQNNERRQVKIYEHYGKFGDMTCEAQLKILNFTIDDCGWYGCQAKSIGSQDYQATKIELHDPRKTFIKLYCAVKNRFQIQSEGGYIMWTVNINAYPQPTCRWIYNPGNSKMQTLYDESIRHLSLEQDSALTYTKLTISYLMGYHSGNYTLEVSNIHENKSITFSIYVTSKPIFNIKAYAHYASNQLVVIRNEISSYPACNVTWKYLTCSDTNDCSDNNIVKWTLREKSPIMFETIVKFHVEMSGNITCIACNAVGCRTISKEIFVSDYNSGMGIIFPEHQLTNENDLELICFASIYNYTNNLTWLIDGQNITENDSVKLTTETTQISHRITLSIKKLLISHAAEYTCVAIANDFKEYKEYYVLNLADPEPATIVETNMNGTEVAFDLNTLRQNIELICTATGIPEPTVTWYKDQHLLESNNQYFFTGNKQKLKIKYLDEKSSGKYVCRAKNRLAIEERFLTFISIGNKVSETWILISRFVLIVCCIFITTYCIIIRQRRIKRQKLIDAGLTFFKEGALESINPELTLEDQAEHLPYDKKWEFPQEKLALGTQLGSGAFGVVRKAKAVGIMKNEKITTVAVKMIKRTLDPMYIKALASELKIMVHLGKHINIVNLLGACTKNISKHELLIILEYCHFGNLHNYLLRQREDFIDQIDPATGKFNVNIKQKFAFKTDNYVEANRTNHEDDYKDEIFQSICTQDLTSWAFQVARGMEYLSGRKVLHGDLAARNILLTENNIVKISDFGLSKSMYKDNNYKKKDDLLLPIKWMAIESIRDRVFSTQSDVWSFGVVLWEFFTLAQTPYFSIDAETQYQKLIEGYRLEKPEYATKEMYDIIQQCWTTNPILRPSFSELANSIGDFLEKSVQQYYIDLNRPYVDLNTKVLQGKNDYLKMMSAPDHTLLSSSQNYVKNSTIELVEKGDFAHLSLTSSDQDGSSNSCNDSRTQFRSLSPVNDKSSAESVTEEMVEFSILQQDDDDQHLKPMNFHEHHQDSLRTNNPDE
ncbi:vascular endothelial growth factor receptor 1-like isoform X2 [Leptopilina boulardi]|uniref:vascular endothelial growth factor receptor 1-like isoform X2 n=1 Tax=Leptopilina boulardi TaxID=63433 RepID=UPI0021F66F12|nr:vascular endothelial growth factor receptor 1-like isoform X2 [Leptopilina boulardi]